MIIFKWLTFGSLFIFWTCDDAYKILVVFPTPWRSHRILGDAVVKYLLEAGHEVTYITPFPKNASSQNLRYIDVSANVKYINENTINLKAALDKKIRVNVVKVAFTNSVELTEKTFENENVQNLLKDHSQQFDLVLTEWLFAETYSAFSAVFECPFIWFSTTETHSIVLSLIDEPLNPAYNMGYMNKHSTWFKFLQRFEELCSHIIWRYYEYFHSYYLQEKVYETYIVPILKAKGKHVPSLKDLRYNASMVLGNSHVCLGQATRLPDNYKGVGGYHLGSNREPLPRDLQEIMNNSKNGVIYFSMGSFLNSKDLPDEIKRNLLKVFGELKQTVLWKFEENLPHLPDNVHILKWAPQQSILSHPNCILFITHGGLLSIIEAINYAVPVIGMAVYADQFRNVDTAVSKGFGIRVDLTYTMVDDIKAAVIKMINDSSYRKEIKELSLIFHDRPVKPAKELIHWVEHVIRTRGAPHLRSLALHMPWYQKIYLDLFAMMLTIILILNALLRRLLYVAKRRSITSENKKKKKLG